jgi:Tfp pilus assembly protein FimT
VTLLEIMVVLAILAGLGGLIAGVTRKVTGAELREKTGEVAEFLRQAYALAASSNVHHRVVFNLDEQSFALEECPDPLFLKKQEEEESEDEKTSIERMKENIERGRQTAATQSEVAEAETPEEALKRAAAIEGVSVGNTRCKTVEGLDVDLAGRGFERKIDSDDVRIKKIHVQHLKDPVEEKKASVNFFPLGYAEKAVIEIGAKDGDTSYVVVHRLTGRIETRSSSFEPEAHMRRQAAGREVEDR